MKAGGNTFTKQERLCSDRLIERLFREGNRKIAAFPVRLVWLLLDDAGFEGVQILISAPKRNFHHAVDRNRIKRQIREFYRNSSAPLKEAVASRHKSLALAFLFNDTVLWDSGKLDERLKSAFDRLVVQVLGSTAEIILSLIREDGRYTKLEAETLDLALILHAEHGGGNNSSFVTHVVTSSFTDIYSSLAASVLSLKGMRHGGANLRVMRQMDEIKRNVKEWRNPNQVVNYLEKIADKRAGDKSGLIYGLGHAVYTLSDPRAQLLRRKARELAREKRKMDEMRLFETIETRGPAVIKSRHPRAEDICANVDLYSGFVYDMLGIPRDLYTPLFAVARCVSWCAHRMEELINQGPIIRPAYKPIYRPKEYVNLKDR